jgi:hypothetical protein
MVDVVFGLLIAVPAVLVIASFVISSEKSRRSGSTNNRRPPRG